MNTAQVDQMMATTTNMIMQVDGADDDLENLDEDHSETEYSKSNIPTKNGTVSQNLKNLLKSNFKVNLVFNALFCQFLACFKRSCPKS